MDDVEFKHGHNLTPKVCGEPITCFTCGKAFGTCHEVETTLNNGGSMIPRDIAGGGNAPSGGGARGARSGFPYLNQTNQATYLSTDKKTVKILDVKVNLGEKNPVTVKLAIDGKQVLWGLNGRNPNMDILLNAYGTEERDWVGNTMGMNLEQDEFTGQVWPRCDPAYKAAAARGK